MATAAAAPPSGEAAAQRWCVVTGGRGFLGRHLVTMLLSADEGWCVRITDLSRTISVDPDEEDGLLGDSIRSGRAAYVGCDLRNKAQVLKAFEGAELVFHMAAPDSSINNYQLHYSVNVEGTRNVIDACIQCKVKRLIYTSSPSVVFSGEVEIFNVDETMPYPRKFNDSYSETKAEGEKLVIKANGRDGLLTCCIRPSGLFGPGDKLLVPSLVEAARSGKSKFIIGDGDNLYDFTYVENVAYGHLCAERALSSENTAKTVAGKAYFITNAEPIKFWEFMSLILEGLGYERPSVKVPVSVAMPIAHVIEYIYKAFSRFGMRVPQMTPSRVRLLSRSRTFNCTRAKGLLGYKPIVSLEDGIKRTLESYSHLRAQKSNSVSKAAMYLGNGSIARVVLWKDKKQTITTLLFLYVTYYHLCACGYTFITAIAKLLSLCALFLFVHGMLPTNILGYRVEKLQPSNFHITQSRAHEWAQSVASSWNYSVAMLKSICKGEDWPLFIKIVSFLLVVDILAVLPLDISFKLGTLLFFVAFNVYEKYEVAIDKRMGDAYSYAKHLTSSVARNT